MSEEEKKKKSDPASTMLAIFLPLVVLVPIGIAIWEELGTHIYGATPDDLASVSLASTPKQLGRALPHTDVRGSSVYVKLKVGPSKPYEKATFQWGSDLSSPNGIELDAEHESPSVRPALARRLHGLHNGSFTWNHVSFNASKSRADVSFSIDASQRTDPLFNRQLEAAREVLLNAAFNTPIQVSDRELADVLGTGYPTKDVAKLDASVPLEGAHDAVMKLFPGALSTRADSFEIAIDHPLFRSVSLSWTNQPQGRLTSLSLSETDAFKASRSLFATCLAQKLGPALEKVTDYAAGTKELSFKAGSITLLLRSSHTSLSGSYDASSVALLFTTLDACRDSNEAETTSRDEKK